MFGLTTTKKLDEAKEKNVEFYKMGLYDGLARQKDIDIITSHCRDQVKEFLGIFQEDLKRSHREAIKQGVYKSIEVAMKYLTEQLNESMTDAKLRFSDKLMEMVDDFSALLKEKNDEASGVLNKSVKALQATASNFIESLYEAYSKLSANLDHEAREFGEVVTNSKDELTQAVKTNKDELNQAVKTNKDELTQAVKTNQDVLYESLSSLQLKHRDLQQVSEDSEIALREATEKAKAFDVAGIFTSKVKAITDALDKAVMLARKSLEDEMHEILADLNKAIKETHKKAADDGAWEGASTAISAAVEQMLNMLDPRTLLQLSKEKDREETTG